MAVITAILFIIVCGLLHKIYSEGKLNQGERLVMEMLTNSFDKKEYYLFNNVTLRHNNSSTQVDHVLVSKFGIFVIETKYYSGWIFASQKSKFWTQTFPNRKNKFQNPLHQNYKHILALKNLIEDKKHSALINVVVFAGDAVFKKEKPDSVLYLKELTKFILSKKEEILSEDDVLKIIGIIERERYAISQQTDIEHAAMLKRKFRTT